MLGRPLAGVAPASSWSSPSTTTTSRRPSSSAWAAIDASRLSHVLARATATAGDTPPVGPRAMSCSIMASKNASLSAWPAKRSVMKNDTTSALAGGCVTNHDASALFPAHGPACHHAYGSGPAQNSAHSARSSSRPISTSGAMSRTCSR